MTESNVEETINRGMQNMLKGLHEALSSGVPRVGWKVGITDQCAQQKLGLTSSLMASLAGNRTIISGQTLTLNDGVNAHAEAEIAIRIGNDLGSDCSLDDARRAIQSLGPAIEIIDLNKPADSLESLLGHNIFHEGVIFGEEKAPDAFEKVDASMPTATKNGEPARDPEPSIRPDDLAKIVLMVANRLGQNGETLKAGDRIISGSFIKPLEVAAGDTVNVDFGPMGAVDVTLA